MNVVHINTVDVGGAANAAYQLHDGLVKKGFDSKFLVLHHTNSSKDVVTFETPSRRSFNFFLRKVKQRVRSIREGRILKKLSDQIEIFSSPNSIYDILAHPAVKNADLIHLHWVANFIDYSSFFRKNKKPIIWTFHDENTLFGGIHYADDLLKLSPSQLGLERIFAGIKKDALQRAGEIWPICPSPWLLGKVQSSTNRGVFRNATCIYYGVDTNQFSLLDKTEAQRQFHFSLGKRMILLICSNLNVYRKGFDLFCELVKKITKDDNVEFILAGQVSNLPPLNFSTYIGPVTDRATLVQLYNAVDATLIPSREDNLPNVMIESLSCGTPVLGFEIGGIQNVIEEQVDGLLSPEVSANGLYKLVRKFLSSNSFDREVIRKRAIDRFDNDIQVEKVTKLYQECIQQNV